MWNSNSFICKWSDEEVHALSYSLKIWNKEIRLLCSYSHGYYFWYFPSSQLLGVEFMHAVKHKYFIAITFPDFGNFFVQIISFISHNFSLSEGLPLTFLVVKICKLKDSSFWRCAKVFIFIYMFEDNFVSYQILGWHFLFSCANITEDTLILWDYSEVNVQAKVYYRIY